MVITAIARTAILPPQTRGFTKLILPSMHEKESSTYSDPYNFTANWVGPDVGSYKAVYCTFALDDPKIRVVAGSDLNFADIAGFLPDEYLGLLTGLELIHLNSNRFCGIIPQTLTFHFYISLISVINNRFVGTFPSGLLSLPMLKCLDHCYTEFEGPLPQLFQKKKIEAISVNNNRFTNAISAILDGT
ncbi:hypothetical protein Peur_025958 [Populus x canadensis]